MVKTVTPPPGMDQRVEGEKNERKLLWDLRRNLKKAAFFQTLCHHRLGIFHNKGFPCGSAGKERIHLQCRRPEFDPWVGKIPWRKERLPTPVVWPGEFHGLYSPWGAHFLSGFILSFSLCMLVTSLSNSEKHGSRYPYYISLIHSHINNQPPVTAASTPSPTKY